MEVIHTLHVVVMTLKATAQHCKLNKQHIHSSAHAIKLIDGVFVDSKYVSHIDILLVKLS
jgi:hypothetical protein